MYCDYFIWCVSCAVVVVTCFVMCVCMCVVMCGCVCVCMGFIMCVCVCVWDGGVGFVMRGCFDNYVGVLVICALVFTVFCIACIVFFIVSFIYINLVEVQVQYFGDTITTCYTIHSITIRHHFSRTIDITLSYTTKLIKTSNALINNTLTQFLYTFYRYHP